MTQIIMKRFILLVFAALLVIACTETEGNSPALQAELDGAFFKANGLAGVLNDDGTVVIQGFTENEAITLRLSGSNLGVYKVGGEFNNSATFEDSNGSIYTTVPSGEGQVEITDKCIGCTDGSFLTGNFFFTALIPGLDTLAIDKGVFFKAPLDGGDQGGLGNAGTVFAEIDGNSFNATSVEAGNTGSSIVITGSTVLRNIVLRLPSDVAVGTYELPEAGFGARYTVDNMPESANSGTIVVVEHDTAAKTIKGAFAFITDGHSISQGQFVITY